MEDKAINDENVKDASSIAIEAEAYIIRNNIANFAEPLFNGSMSEAEALNQESPEDIPDTWDNLKVYQSWP